jgi:pentatricopeptide repeat protein
MQRAGVQPTAATYSAVITALRSCGQWQKALQLFNSMKLAGVQPDTIAYNAVITGAVPAGSGRQQFNCLKSCNALLQLAVLSATVL